MKAHYCLIRNRSEEDGNGPSYSGPVSHMFKYENGILDIIADSEEKLKYWKEYFDNKNRRIETRHYGNPFATVSGTMTNAYLGQDEEAEMTYLKALSEMQGKPHAQVIMDVSDEK